MKPIQTYAHKTNVLDETRKRISFIFDNFEDIKVSVSGGKDSTVLAHLVLTEAERRNRRVGVFFLDEEVVYQSTVDQVTYLMEEMKPKHTIPLWLQIEFNLTNATSFQESQMISWEAGKSHLWMRPKKSYSIKFPNWDTSKQTVADKNKGFGFYDVFKNFESCYKNAAHLVGLRATESPNRWRTVSKNPVSIGGKNIYWATQKAPNFAMYPIYDWNFSDIWRYIYENNLRYSRIYDYQFMKGYSINEIRVSSLIHEKSFKSICDLPEFEPKTYNKLIKRIKGIALAQETGKDAKLFRARKLPKNFQTWMTYRDFLLETYPDASKKHLFLKRFDRHLDNNYVARQQCRQLILNDYENNLPVDNKPDPRDALIEYYMNAL